MTQGANMKFLKSLYLILLIPLALSACGPAAASPAAPVATIEITSIPLAAAGKPAPVPTDAAAQPLPQATSRGDKLEASDPALVKLGAGRPVLVEFFRFT
jgi:hypothetical protein